MPKSNRGVPFCGTPFLLWGLWLLPGAALAEPAVPMALGNTVPAAERVVLQADFIRYAEESGELFARGQMRMWYGALTLTADQAEASLETRLVKARGQVHLAEGSQNLQCAELEYSLRDRSARARGILYATYPWYYQGESVEKTGDKQVAIRRPRFTTCNAYHPHFHLTASRIEVVLGESLTAYNCVFFVGTTPLFYLPWMQRSLKDQRPPFSIRVGYNDYEGFYGSLLYNYGFWENNPGTLTLKVSEKKGPGYGLEQRLRYSLLGRGEGMISAFYVREKDTGRERWTAKLEDRHEFSPRSLLQMNADYLSDQAFNREFTTSLVDSFEQKTYLTFSHRDDAWYFNASFADTETWDPMGLRYYTSLRQLPGLAFSTNPWLLLSGRQPLYLNFNSSFIRTYNRIIGLDSSEAYQYLDSLALTPSLSQTYGLPVWIPTRPSLSASLSMPVSGWLKETLLPQFYPDTGDKPQQWQGSYSATVSLGNQWVRFQRTTPTHLLQSRLSYSFSRNFPIGEAMNLPLAGVAGSSLGLSADYAMGAFFSIQGNTGYDLLNRENETRTAWQERMSPFAFYGQATPLREWSINWQGSYDYAKNRILNATASTQVRGTGWNLGLNGSYAYRDLSLIPEAYYLTIVGGWQAPLLSVQATAQYDFSISKLNSFTAALSHDLHCWSMQGMFRVYLDGKAEIGLGINLKAFPEFKAGMGGLGGFEVGQ